MASREAAQSLGLYLLMKVTISPFLFVTLQFVLARSSLATTFALPPVMTVFPFIPVLAYSLIISAFSYISARILKHFNFSSDLLAFLRRKGRLAPRPTTHSHELLPTSTASPSPTPLFGMYAASSNVTPRSSLDALPVLPPRLISPPSSPPSRPQSRRVTNPLSSFSILKPTSYRHKHRRSRSLGVPTLRPRYWTSQFPPSPPVQRETEQENIRGRRRNTEDDIPLTFLSGGSEHPSERRTLLPAPVLHEPSMSAPILLAPDFGLQPSIHGPLVDISPLSPDSTSSSSCQASSVTGPSDSSSELALQPSYSSSDANSLSSLSRSTQGSDIGGQTIGRLGDFAYDWGFDGVSDPNFVESLQRPHESSSMPLPSDIMKDYNIPVTSRKDSNDSPSGIDILGDQDTSLEIATGSALVQVPTSTQWNSPSMDDMDGHWASTNSAHPTLDASTTEETTLATSSPPLVSEELVISNDIQPDSFQAVVSKSLENGKALYESETTPQRLGEDPWDEVGHSTSPPPIEDSHAEEQPLVSISTFDLIDPPKRRNSLSARGGECLSPLSPSQTPTPPASPPLTSMEVSEDLTGIKKSHVKAVIVSPMSKPASPIKAKEEDMVTAEGPLVESTTDGEGLDLICQEDVEHIEVAQAGTLGEGPEYDNVEDKASLVNSHASPPVCKADVQPLGVTAVQTSLVQGEMTWPKETAKAGNEDNQNEKADEAAPASSQHVQPAVAPVEDQDMLPGTFPESESATKKQAENTFASSTEIVTASGLSHRRRSMRIMPLDVALAMQMRPGLGVGADPAWMVRFLMAVFGWFTIMIAGRGGEVDVYAL